ncbi:MAG TPA: hypothetical protein PKA88_16645 [Polyangiaceae bacterium]|nr:hypothetical protein [Polyangiaceae bacterium]
MTGQVGCAVEADGRVLCWYKPDDGRPMLQRYVPFLPEVVEARVGYGAACARSTKGEVWCFSPTSDNESVKRAKARMPVRVPPARRLFMKHSHVCGELMKGGFACWKEAFAEDTLRLYPRATAVGLGFQLAVASPGQIYLQDSNGRGRTFPVRNVVQLEGSSSD